MALEATYRQDGKIINFANTGSAIVEGEIVPIVGGIAVAADDIAATTGTGNVYIEGVFKAASVTNASFAVGDVLYWDNSGKVLQKVVTAYKAGICTLTKATSTATAEFKLANDGSAVAIAAVKATADAAATAASMANVLMGTSAAKKVVGATANVTGTLDVVTGLATVVAVVVSMGVAPSANTTMVYGKAHATPGTITIETFKYTANDNCTPTASSTATAIHWVAYGT
ncbi:MAG: DUF2190 family protein [Legionellales bacterium]|jgi:predicted RecA/RadA family phage recombinase